MVSIFENFEKDFSIFSFWSLTVFGLEAIAYVMKRKISEDVRNVCPAQKYIL